MVITDFHTHIFPPETDRNRKQFLGDANFFQLYADPAARIIDHTNLLEAMTANSVNRSVAMGFPWISESLCARQNDYFSLLSSESNGKIVPFGSVPSTPDVDTAPWVQKIHDLGLAGIGEVAFYNDGLTSKNALFLESLLDSASRYGLPVCIHVNEPVGHHYPGKYRPEFDSLHSVIRNAPDATIILSHWGGGILFYELMPEVKKSFSRVFYDTAASPYLYDDRIYRVAMSIIGPEKIVFGSDYPLINPSRYIKSIKTHIKPATDAEMVLGVNAEAVLAIGR